MIMLLWLLCTYGLLNSICILYYLSLVKIYWIWIGRQVYNQIFIAEFNRNFRLRPRKRWSWSTRWNNRVLICTMQSRWLTCLISPRTRRWRKRPVTCLYAGKKAVFLVVFLIQCVSWYLSVLHVHRRTYYPIASC